jgi:hypothetical protein
VESSSSTSSFCLATGELVGLIGGLLVVVFENGDAGVSGLGPMDCLLFDEFGVRGAVTVVPSLALCEVSLSRGNARSFGG